MTAKCFFASHDWALAFVSLETIDTSRKHPYRRRTYRCIRCGAWKFRTRTTKEKRR